MTTNENLILHHGVIWYSAGVRSWDEFKSLLKRLRLQKKDCPEGVQELVKKKSNKDTNVITYVVVA